MKKIMFCRN